MSEADDFLSGEDEDETEDGAVEAEPVESPVTDEDTIDVPASTAEGELDPTSVEGVLQPASDSLEELADVYETYEKVKTKILTNDDRQKIGGNFHIKKSGWRKIATAFNVSVNIVDKEKIVEDGIVTWRVTARAVAPNGKAMESTGTAASNESNHMEKVANDRDQLENDPYYSMDDDSIMKIDGAWRRLRDPRAVNEHNILATAETRAKNRAISDLVGGGEVSVEEMDPSDMI